MKRTVLSTLLVLGLATSASADWKNSDTERVKVQSVTKITKPYTKKIKTGEQCYDTTVEVPVSCGYSNGDTNSIGVDTIIGGALGYALGNQVGRGSGRDAARGVGTVLGMITANNTRNGRNSNSCTSYETVTKCNPQYDYKTIRKTVGYNNCATIDGVEYCKQTSRPIKFLKVKRTIQVW